MATELKELEGELDALQPQWLKARAMARRYSNLPRYTMAYARLNNRKHELEARIHELRLANPYR